MDIFCKFDELVSPKILKDHPKNRNKHGQDQIERLADLYKTHGIRHPIIVSNFSKAIVAGHGRKLAAIRAGLKEVPVVYQDFKDKQAEYAFLQSDNAIALWAELDISGIKSDILDFGPEFDINSLGIKDFMIEESKEGMCDEDEVPEVVEPKSKLGDIYQLGEHRLMCGDSTSIDAVEKLMNGEKADMVFTDPPYGINEQTDRAFAARSRKAKGNTFKKIAGDENTDCAIDACNLLLSLNIPTMVIWGGNYFCHSLPQQGNWLVWDKREDDKERDFNSDCELAWSCHPNRPSVRIFRHKWKGMIKASEHGQARVHPTQKPIALAEWCFDELAKESKSVLDLFGGSGSTLIACEKTNRKCFMMELDPHYCDVIVARWEKFTGKSASLVSGKKQDV